LFTLCNKCGTANTLVPTSLPVACLDSSVSFLNELIELIKHDVRQQGRNNAALRNAGGTDLKHAFIDMPGLEKAPQQGDESRVSNAPFHASNQALMVYRIEVAGEIAFDYPPAL